MNRNADNTKSEENLQEAGDGAKKWSSHQRVILRA